MISKTREGLSAWFSTAGKSSDNPSGIVRLSDPLNETASRFTERITRSKEMYIRPDWPKADK
jgi:hypothetical protein